MQSPVEYQCYYCEELLEESNSSTEHIIPNALGGKLKSKKLLCKKCNSKLGELLDAEITKALRPVMSLLYIPREKGVTSNLTNLQTSSGEKYHLEKGITPVPIAPKINIDEKNNHIRIRARDEKEMEHIITQLQKKYPHLDKNSVKDNLTRTAEFLEEPLEMQLSIGSPGFMKAILKMAINFYLLNVSRPNDITARIADIKSNNSLSPDIVRPYYTTQLANNKSEHEVAHTLFIRGITEAQLLYAYVELFSSFSFIVNLNTSYNGPDIEYQYSFDVLTRSQIDKAVSIYYNGNLAGNFVDLNASFVDLLQNKLNRIFTIGNSRQIKEIISQKIDEAADITLKRPPGVEEFSSEMIEAFLHSVSSKLAPYLAHFSNKKDR